MAKNAITDFSTTAADNTDVGGVGIQGTNAISNIDNALRELMSQLADTNAGTAPWADTMTIGDAADLTKEVRFELSGITAGQTRVLTVPDSNGTLMTSGAHPTLATIEALTLGAGDMLYATAADTITDLAIGTAGQFLVTNAGATAPEWASRPTLVSLEGLTLGAGDIVYATAADTLADLAIGTAGQSLIVNAGATAPSWGSSIVSGTAQATTSGTTKDFTIPSWAKRVTVQFVGVTMAGADNLLIQIGDSGGIEIAGYVSSAGAHQSTNTSTSTSTAGFTTSSTASAIYGEMTLSLADAATNSWTEQHSISYSNFSSSGGGGKALSGVLTTVRVTSASASTFSAGLVNVLYE